MEQQQEQQEQQEGQQVDAQKVINSLLRQMSEAVQKIAVLEALLESK
jgi:hypothetical protein